MLARTLCRTLSSGTGASLLSTAAVAVMSWRHTGSAVSGTNATSHWLWGERAKRRRQPSWKYTLPGYVVHHASAMFWAVFFEHATRRTRSPAKLAGAAATTAVVAYAVDYHVVPRRLTPGFESRLPKGGLIIAYAAFTAGLWGARLLHQKVEQRLQRRAVPHATPRAVRPVPAASTAPAPAQAPAPMR